MVRRRCSDIARFAAYSSRIATTTPSRDADSIRALHRAHERFLDSGAAPGVRDLVAESWRRSAAAGVDVDDPLPQITVPADELAAYRDAHPLARVFPLLYDVLGRAAEECDSVMAVGDAHGQLLWVCGRPGVLDSASSINFVEGSRWDETSAGTNAPGTALLLDTPVQILAAEHFARPVQPWTCAAAPIHDPVTQSILGIVDVTGSDDIASPQTLAMVRAAARMAEAELGRLVVQTSRSRVWTPSTGVTVGGLGRPDCLLDSSGRTVRLSPRHSEILVILSAHPDGITGDQLAVELYAEDVSASTMRAELTRLRSLLGDGVIGSRPYRLKRDITCDWVLVERAIDAQRPAEALRHYRGPLLPHSDAPGVVERREHLERRLRAAVLASGEVDLMAAWTRSRWGADDRDLWQRQLELAPAETPLHTIARSEVRRLDREFGIR